MIFITLVLIALAFYQRQHTRFYRLIVRDLWWSRFQNKRVNHQQWLPNHHQRRQFVGRIARV